MKKVANIAGNIVSAASSPVYILSPVPHSSRHLSVGTCQSLSGVDTCKTKHLSTRQECGHL